MKIFMHLKALQGTDLSSTYEHQSEYFLIRVVHVECCGLYFLERPGYRVLWTMCLERPGYTLLYTLLPRETWIYSAVDSTSQERPGERVVQSLQVGGGWTPALVIKVIQPRFCFSQLALCTRIPLSSVH